MAKMTSGEAQTRCYHSLDSLPVPNRQGLDNFTQSEDIPEEYKLAES